MNDFQPQDNVFFKQPLGAVLNCGRREYHIKHCPLSCATNCCDQFLLKLLLLIAAAMQLHYINVTKVAVAYILNWPCKYHAFPDFHVLQRPLQRWHKYVSTFERHSVTRFFSSSFFYHTTSSGPSRHAQKRFRNFSHIRGVIRNRNRLPADEYTGESIIISQVS